MAASKDMKARDIEDKVSTIRYIIKKCREDFKASHQSTYLPAIVKAVRYTGKELSIMRYVESLPVSENIDEWIKEKNSKDKCTINSITMHEMLVNYYVEKRITLPKKSLKQWEAIKNSEGKGFTWYDIPNSNKRIFIEDPEQQAARIKYLLKMEDIRNKNKDIVYVEQDTYEIWNDAEENTQEKHVLCAASPNIGLIACTFVPNLKFDVSEWIERNVVPYLNDSSALVIGFKNLEDDADYLTVPKPSDSTAKMISWLQRNRISHMPSMHRAELYALIEKYNTTVLDEKKYKYEEILKATGVEVLRKPNWDTLYYFRHVWSDYKSNLKKHYSLNFETNFHDFIKNYDLSVWQQFDRILENIEKKLYDNDMQLEEVVDRLLMFGKYNNINDSQMSEQIESKVLDPYKYNFII
ncbi:uncharacterized protein ACR2FA_010626 [Aphomia sociella]